MRVLREYIGAHEGLRLGQLTEREVAMLLLCAGRKAGFVARTEVSTPTQNSAGKEVRGEVDIGWFDAQSGALIVAWEIDGQDAGQSHFLGHIGRGTAGNVAKFNSSKALIKVQVLYSVKNDLTIKAKSKQSQISQWLGGAAGMVTDEELFASNGIEHWMDIARQRVEAA